MMAEAVSNSVIPAQAVIHLCGCPRWIPAFAGMTEEGKAFVSREDQNNDGGSRF